MWLPLAFDPARPHLIHLPTLALNRGILRAAGPADRFLLLHPGCPVFALAVSYLFFRGVEKPGWEAGRRVRQEGPGLLPATPSPVPVV